MEWEERIPHPPFGPLLPFLRYRCRTGEGAVRGKLNIFGLHCFGGCGMATSIPLMSDPAETEETLVAAGVLRSMPFVALQ